MSFAKILIIFNQICYILLGLLVFCITTTSTETSTSRTIEEENAQIFYSDTVQGEIAELPCNITTPKENDRISTVIWYKNETTSPIYTYDAREPANGKHWSDPDILKGRGRFELYDNKILAVLHINKTKFNDAGLYRCRVDFFKSPTKNSKINLTIIIPPENILILDEKGSHIPHYILGPYNEGASVELTCVSTGGRPLPQLTWWHENTVLDETFSLFGDRKVKNILKIDKLNRHHMYSVLTCQAANNNVSTPISSAVRLDMNLRPLWVKLTGENKPLSAGQEYALPCEVVGARPAPIITWWKGSVQMTNTKEVSNSEGNITISTLSFTPTMDDGGKFLSCRGEQSLIPDSGLESGWKLDIHHVPVVSLEIGSNVNSTIIKEGADVYFECNIKSNPWIYKVSWRHNGKHLYNNALPGIIVANQSLVLQNVSRSRSGIYTCIGSNKEGDGESNHVHLDIKFAPICRPGQAQNYGVARKETAKIICELEANPHDVNFTWRFNSSNSINNQVIDIPVTSFTVDRAKSIAHYTPLGENDYGTLLCWGSNEIGGQIEPCIYNINPAGRPDPPSNCTVLNQTSDILQLECIEGFDGGLPQEFLIKVYSARTKQLIASQTSKIPYFEIKGLELQLGYDITLAAFNKKGESDLTFHHIYTLNSAEKHTDFLLPYPGSVLHMKLFLGAIAGLIFGVILISIAVLIIMRVRKKNKKKNKSDLANRIDNDGEANCMMGLSGGGGGGGGGGNGGGGNCGGLLNGQSNNQNSCNTNNDGANTMRDTNSGSTDSLDEKNPDIIPQSNDEEKSMKWLNTMQPHTYATMTGYQLHENPGFLTQQPMHHHHHHHQIMGNNPTSFGELSLVIPKQNQQAKTIYTSATLGRPRYKDNRLNEPTIYAQIDLAHNPISLQAGQQVTFNDATVTWIPASQPSQIIRQYGHIHEHDQRTVPIVCTRESTNLTQLPLDHRIMRQSSQSPPVVSSATITNHSNTTGQISRF